MQSISLGVLTLGVLTLHHTAKHTLWNVSNIPRGAVVGHIRSEPLCKVGFISYRFSCDSTDAALLTGGGSGAW